MSEKNETLGRPTDYTVDLGERICDAIATSKVGLDHICNAIEDFPAAVQVYRWVIRDEAFRKKYREARSMQSVFMAESAIDITNERHTYNDHHGNVRIDPGAVSLQALQVKEIHYQASKLAPRLYGDKLEISADDNLGAALLADVINAKKCCEKKYKKDY